MTTTGESAPSPTVAAVITALEARYPPADAAAWDRIGLVVGRPSAPVDRVLLAVDCVAETVAEAIGVGAQLMVVHHPLLLKGVHSVATTTYKGELIHQLISAGIALFVAHTNADVAHPGVTDALAARLGLRAIRPLLTTGRHPTRVGELPEPVRLATFAADVVAALPATAAGVRVAGDRDAVVSVIALTGGAGDEFLADVSSAGVDVYLTADLRHHVASEHLASGGPALIDAAHWATERPWLDVVAAELRQDLPIDTVVSDVVTDVWNFHVPSPSAITAPMDIQLYPDKESRS